MTDAELHRVVRWRDLLDLGRADVARELGLSLPWLALSWLAASSQQHPLALAASFMFFLTGLRQVHNAFHYAIGVSRAATEWVMFVMSVVMLGSMHAIQLNHLRHHRHCLEDEDLEAKSAQGPAWRALLTGPLFPLRLHRKALAVGDARQRRWIAAELAANAIVITLVFAWPAWPWLRYHVLAMALGQCLTAFFAVWTVHRGCEARGAQSRTIRGRFKSLLTYDMFLHIEHHLFPAVPTRRLWDLAVRLDAVAPERAANRAF